MVATERPVLVVTSLDDVTADLVIARLYERAVPVVRLDPVDCPDEVTMTAFLGSAGMSGRLTTPSRALRLDTVRSVYWRRPSAYRPATALAPAATPAATPALTPTPAGPAAEWAVQETRWGFGGVLATLPGALYVNHPWRVRDAESKVMQLASAGACGFNVPPGVVTTDLDAAATFIAAHGRVVYKPLSGEPMMGSDGRFRTVWVRRVELDELDETVGLAPHLFQAEVDKVADVRITAVGKRLVAVRIDGARGLDWREDYSALRFSRIEVPDSVAAAIRAYLQRFGLVFTAFDLGLDRSGALWWYEGNPNGQWAFYNQAITNEIAIALADVLEQGSTTR